MNRIYCIQEMYKHVDDADDYQLMNAEIICVFLNPPLKNISPCNLVHHMIPDQ
ncbi:unnamed protein product [Schistosoma mattheei]|uniref:Uncharacterized protein n=1 Tax=Schistosoma mattheei TaxID=31246 RepID=A0A3P8L2A9_9TREM|nr:unnamed protein product [Schistosoma mattheei]